MLKNLLIVIISLFIVLASSTTSVVASGVEKEADFGSCVDPKIAASQVNTGNDHGVIGQAKKYSGVDKIYNLTEGNVLQCLCPDSGTGIQTNWYKASKLSDSEIKVMEKKGWTYVATGSSWGLEDVPYLAKNSDYACREKVLAATGNSVAIYGFILAGFVLIIVGLLLKRAVK